LKSTILNSPISIGIGGQIGSGKTTVVKELIRLYQNDGYKVMLIDADRIAWRFYKQSTNIYKRIVKIFGISILDKKNNIDRKSLGKLVFKKPSNLTTLNKIVHPELIRQIKFELRKPNKQMKILDAALLFLWGKKIPVNIRILITAPAKQKIARMKKRGYNPIEVKTRLKRQIKESDMKADADFIINNNTTLAGLEDKTKKLYQILKNY
jgi:dephospho-CoA kinase